MAGFVSGKRRTFSASRPTGVKARVSFAQRPACWRSSGHAAAALVALNCLLEALSGETARQGSAEAELLAALRLAASRGATLGGRVADEIRRMLYGEVSTICSPSRGAFAHGIALPV